MPLSRISRRRFLRLTSGALLGAGLSGFSKAGSADATESREPRIHASVGSLAGAVRDGDIRSRDLVELFLRRIEEVNPWLNAVVELTAERARAAASHADQARAAGRPLGPLHGIPMTIKDSLDTAGVVTTWGVPARAGFVPARDATVVARLKQAGAVLLGKTNTPELTFSFETNSPVHGVTNNPYDVDRTPGGSSGGAAAIVAAGGSAFDVGSDTGGSVRLPSHFCGVAGIRPTSGRVPRTGNAVPPGGLLDELTQIGPIARYVEDLALLLGIIAGPDGKDPSVVSMPLYDFRRVNLEDLKAAYFDDNGIHAPTEATRATVAAAVELLGSAGLRLKAHRPAPIEATFDLFVDLFNWDGGAWRDWLAERAASRAPSTEGPSKSVQSREVIALFDRWDRFRRDMLSFFDDYDLLISPVNAYPALPHGKASERLEAFSYTMTYSLTGWPAVVVRAGSSPEGLPIAVQIAARPWREDVALAVAAEVEHRLGGWRLPPL